jgi:hypothetical protein
MWRSPKFGKTSMAPKSPSHLPATGIGSVMSASVHECGWIHLDVKPAFRTNACKVGFIGKLPPGRDELTYNPVFQELPYLHARIRPRALSLLSQKSGSSRPSVRAYMSIFDQSLTISNRNMADSSPLARRKTRCSHEPRPFRPRRVRGISPIL